MPYPAGAVSTTDYEAYGYDGSGNRTSFRKRDGKVLTYTFDALNRMTLKQPSVGNSIYYMYDLLGHRQQALFGSSTGQGISETYDAMGRKRSSINSMGTVARKLTFDYDSNGNRIKITYPDGVYFNYVYDGLNRATKIQQSGAITIVSDAWDAQGRRSSETRGAVPVHFGHDALSRLTNLSEDLAGTAQDVTFCLGTISDTLCTPMYNPASEALARSSNNDSYAWANSVNVNRLYTSNGLNEYHTIAGVVQNYDDNGNRTSSGNSIFSYDIENRLIGVSNGVNLTYDPLGQLYQTTGSAAGTTQFLYDGNNLVAEYSGNGTLLRRYVHGTDDDDPCIWFEGADLGTMRSLQTDERGSVVSVVDSMGAVVSINSYDEYGIPQANNVGRFQYTGQAWIPEIGAYYYKARIYSPTIGRFLQVDPVGFEDQLNLYAYGGDNPVSHTDPTGNAAFGQEPEPEVEPEVEREEREREQIAMRPNPLGGPNIWKPAAGSPGASVTTIGNPDDPAAAARLQAADVLPFSPPVITGVRA